MKNSVVISGDVTMDCNIALSSEKSGNEQDWNTSNLACVSWQRGSVLMLHDLLLERARQEGLSKTDIKENIVCPQDRIYKPNKNVNLFFAKWSQFEEQKDKVWRVEEFLGYQEGEKKVVGFSPDKDRENAEIVILDDSNLGFREQGESEFWKISESQIKEVISGEEVKLWTKSLATENKPWVIVKMCNPVADGNLWKYLHEYHAEKLIVVLTIDDLRLTKVQISRELSWELTAQDLVRELIYNQSVNSLADCAFVVILFGTDGAVLLSRRDSDKKDSTPLIKQEFDLFFDPAVIEGMWRQDHAGGMIGYKTCMTASIALALQKHLQNSPTRDEKTKDEENPLKKMMKDAVSNGLLAIRQLHLEGYGTKNSKIAETELIFPKKTIAAFLKKTLSADKKPFVSCPIKPPISGSAAEEKEQAFWTILSDRYNPNSERYDKDSDLYQNGLGSVATEIVKRGVKTVLNNVPLGKFGKLTTVDRREIEGFRSIRSLVSEYVHAGTDKPLSIAVFGAPGSGKSFGIAQMAESLLPGKIEKLTFNLSQFSSPDDLWDALHQVRDVSLTEKIPLVFWDEFDTSFNGKLGWLRYFLAPMQDGEFQQGQVTHPIGQAIFVFAGGTAETMRKFEAGEPDETKRKEIKLPDFISRLKGFVNILGPNPTKQSNLQKAKQSNPQKDRRDNYYIIRRAMLLRSIFERNTPQFFKKNPEKSDIEDRELDIDEGVLRALLEVPEYKHGVRSMESVIAMSLTKDKTSFERSSLPSEAQLNLHVDADYFMSLVNKIDFSGDFLEKLSTYLHEVVYAEIYGKPDKRYDELTSDLKELNRKFIREIPNKLAECNCLVVVGRGFHKPFKFALTEIEELAKKEHEEWLEKKLENGFCHPTKKGKKRIPKDKLKESMLFWDKLSDEDFENQPEKYKNAVGRDVLDDKVKQQNRDLIGSIPDILATIGYTIVKKQEKS